MGPDDPRAPRAEPLERGDRRRDATLGDHDAGGNEPGDARQGAGDPPLAGGVDERRVALPRGRDHRHATPGDELASRVGEPLDLTATGIAGESADVRVDRDARPRRRPAPRAGLSWSGRTIRTAGARRRSPAGSAAGATADVPVRIAAKAGELRAMTGVSASAARSPRAMISRSASVSASGTTTAGRPRAKAARIPVATASAPPGARTSASGISIASPAASRPSLRSLRPAREPRIAVCERAVGRVLGAVERHARRRRARAGGLRRG